MKKTLALTLAALAILAVPACSSEDETTPPDDSDVVAVQVTSNTFNPATVRIKVGQTVRWTWGGGSHDVVSGTSCTDDGKFKSGAPMSGGTFEHKFETAGTYPYFCTPHCTMGMTGEVIVE